MSKEPKKKPEEKKQLKRDHTARNTIIASHGKKRAETTQCRVRAKHAKILRYVARKAKEAGITLPTGGKSPRRIRKNLSKILKKMRGGFTEKPKTKKSVSQNVGDAVFDAAMQDGKKS